jgi:oligosaccharide repeat unit polymerase
MMPCLVHPLCLFLLVWGGACVLYLGGVYHGMFSEPSTFTVALVSLNVVTFVLGYLTWTLFRGLDPAPANSTTVPARPFPPETLARALKFTLGMGVAALALEMYRVVAIAYYFQTTWLDLVTQPELLRVRMVAFIQETLFRSSGAVMLLSVTSSLFSIGFVLLGVFLYIDRTGRKHLYLAAFLAISLTIGLIHVSRCEVTANILYLVLAYGFVSSTNRSEREAPDRKASPITGRKSRLTLAVPFAGIVLLFAAIDLLLHKSGEYGLPSRFQGLLMHFYWYIASPLAAFNEFVTTFSGDHQWGRSVFLPFYKWLCRLHLAREIEVSVYGEMVFIPYAANAYTYLKDLYADFGVLGVAVVPYFLGWLMAAIRVKARRHFHFLNLYLVLLLLIFFSFYNYYLASNQIYLQVFFGFALFRYGLPDGGQSGGSPAEGSSMNGRTP